LRDLILSKVTVSIIRELAEDDETNGDSQSVLGLPEVEECLKII
jgi:hypothetical protein